jgi:protein-S-isoprenylcysteine O-methyltransferase Ste14
MPLLKTLLFTLVVPGTAAVLLPRWLARGTVAQLDALGLLGFGLCAVGGAIYLRCAWDFATRGRGTPAPIDPPKELVVSGPYRHVRNPMYVGVLCFVLGQAAVLHSPAVLEYGAILFLASHLFVVAYEEPSLRARFGPSYARYCAAVGRWLPRLRPWNG